MEEFNEGQHISTILLFGGVFRDRNGQWNASRQTDRLGIKRDRNRRNGRNVVMSSDLKCKARKMIPTNFISGGKLLLEKWCESSLEIDVKKESSL